MRRRVLVLGALAAVFAVSWRTRALADLVYAQVHNLVAIGFFVLFARKARKRAGMVAYLPLVLFILFGAFLLHPYALRTLAASGGFSRAPATLGVEVLAYQLAPFDDPSWGIRGVAFFAFAQAAHYVVWLRLVPELDRGAPSPRSFHQTARALVKDVSPWLLVLAGASGVALVTWAFWDVAGARIAYLRSAFFHGYLEVAVLALLACEGWAPEDRGSCTSRSCT